MTWPPPRRKIDIGVLFVWFTGTSLSIGFWAFLIWFAFGCATGHVGADGELHGAAIGEGSKLERCTSMPVGDAGMLTSAPLSTVCARIEGGPILPSIIDILGSAIGGAAKFVVSLWGPAL